MTDNSTGLFTLKDSTSSSVRYTAEQQAIVDFIPSQQDVLITALAGTGKTSTLKFIADTYPNRRGLYLAFNKALQQDAINKFPSHIQCMTIHSLAYRHVGFQYRAQLNNKIYNNQIIEFLNLRDTRYKGHYISASLLAAGIKDMVNAYCNSTSIDINKTHYSRHMLSIVQSAFDLSNADLFEHQTPVGILDFFIKESLRHAPKLWQAVSDCDNLVVPASHDTYLKLYQLSQPKIEDCDYIMLDEAQDANPAMIDILSHQNVQKIFVGDRNQQIYEFRGAINAMNILQGREFHLTQSFRFGPEIADYANLVLKDLGETITLKGLNSIKSALQPLDTSLAYTFIARTNAGLFDNILIAGLNGLKVFFVGGIDRIISLFESAYYLKIDQRHLIQDINIKHFASWQKFADEAWLSNDHEYAAMVAFIENHADMTLERLAVIRDTCRCNEQRANIIMTTAHKSKGRQWPQVRLHDDFLTTDDTNERHIYYVAITRAELVLDCPPVDIVQHTTQLLIELVPSTCWFSNVRSHVSILEWEQLKKITFTEANYCCQICGGKGSKWPVECHEIWNYDDDHKVQTLLGLIALCPPCHQVKHIGLAQLNGHYDQAINHLATVNQWDILAAHKYALEQFSIYHDRSQYEWILDISVLEQYGIDITKLQPETSLDKTSDRFISDRDVGVYELDIKPINQNKNLDSASLWQRVKNLIVKN